MGNVPRPGHFSLDWDSSFRLFVLWLTVGQVTFQTWICSSPTPVLLFHSFPFPGVRSTSEAEAFPPHPHFSSYYLSQKPALSKALTWSPPLLLEIPADSMVDLQLWSLWQKGTKVHIPKKENLNHQHIWGDWESRKETWRIECATKSSRQHQGFERQSLERSLKKRVLSREVFP